MYQSTSEGELVLVKPIKTLYQISTLFWLDNFGVREWKSLSFKYRWLLNRAEVKYIIKELIILNCHITLKLEILDCVSKILKEENRNHYQQFTHNENSVNISLW
jgi:hypothetical protein